MIKTGRSLQDTIDSINESLDSKANKTTTVAGLSLNKSIPAKSLTDSLFKFSDTIVTGQYDVNGNRVEPTPEEINSATNWADAVEILPLEEFAKILAEPDPFGG